MTLCGISSGMFRTSFITCPAFATRLCSFSWPKTGNAMMASSVITPNIFFMVFLSQFLDGLTDPLSGIARRFLFSDHSQRTVACQQFLDLAQMQLQALLSCRILARHQNQFH